MIYGQAAGERVLLGWVVLFDERNNKIIIKNEVLIQKIDVERDHKTARKNEDGERDQMDKERRCRTKKGGGDLFTSASAQHCKLQTVVGRFRQGCVVLNYMSELGCPSKPPGLT